MSDVLVKNMDLPIDCVICPLCRILFDEFNCRATGEWFEIDDKVHRRDDCPLVEVPKHGRLIDADAFIKQNEEGFEEPLMQGEDQIGIREIPMDAVSMAIANAPTILEASE